MPHGGPPQMNVVLSFGIFNVQTATCCTDCGFCCFFSCPIVFGGEVDFASNLQAVMTAEDCTGLGWDCTGDASWQSDDSTILSSLGSGNFSAEGVGMTNLEASDTMNVPDPRDPYCLQGCAMGTLSAFGGGTVAPTVSSIDPAMALIGSVAPVEIDGTGFSGVPSVFVMGSGVSASGTSLQSSTAIDSTLTLDATTTATSVQIGVTVNGVNSVNTVTFTRQIPHLEVFADHELNIDTGCAIHYTQRNITYAIADQDENPITTQLKEIFNSLSSNSCMNGSPSPAPCSVPLSQFTDHLFTGCNAIGGTCGFTLTNQWQSCPSTGTAVALGTTHWNIQNDSTTLTIGANDYSLTFDDAGTRCPTGTKIFP